MNDDDDDLICMHYIEFILMLFFTHMCLVYIHLTNTEQTLCTHLIPFSNAISQYSIYTFYLKRIIYITWVHTKPNDFIPFFFVVILLITIIVIISQSSSHFVLLIISVQRIEHGDVDNKISLMIICTHIIQIKTARRRITRRNANRNQ